MKNEVALKDFAKHRSALIIFKCINTKLMKSYHARGFMHTNDKNIMLKFDQRKDLSNFTFVTLENLKKGQYHQNWV